MIGSRMGSGASKNGNLIPASAVLQHPNESSKDGAATKVTVDSRLPFVEFRELFTLKNYWKTIRRNDQQCAKIMMHMCV